MAEQNQNQDQNKELPKDTQERLNAIKSKLEKFKKQALNEYKEISGITLVPPKEEKKNEINVLLLVDDNEKKIEEKYKFKEDVNKKISEIAKNVDKNIVPEIVLLNELWQNCYDSKYDLLKLISMGAPIYDSGMLSALKISEIHKSMVLKKFEKYVVSYVLGGSLVQGKAKPESDVDVWVVIDDTDVKKLSRVELRDKLRGIILGMANEAGMQTGIKNKLNVQIWILTDFWDGIKEANPVYFTLLRDGIPLYDRGIFMPWKHLLKMGKIKPSPESIDMYMNSGDQMLKKTHYKLNEMGMEDMFWATLNPSQAAIMSYGLPPPTPNETPEILRDIFVKKEGLLEESYVKIIEDIIAKRKELEHDPKKKVTGKEIDKLLSGAEKYLKRIKKLFSQIQNEKEKESVQQIEEDISTIVRDALNTENVEKVKDEELENTFHKYLIETGKLPKKLETMYKNILKARKNYEEGKLTKSEVSKVKKESEKLKRELVEYIQRKRGTELEKTKIRVKHGKKFAEITLLGEEAFIVDDMDAEEKTVYKSKINKDGGLGSAKKSSMDELEKAMKKVDIPEKVFVKQQIFDDLRERYGKDAEVLIHT